MLNMRVEYFQNRTIERYLAGVMRKLDVNSVEMSRFATDLTEIVREDNTDKILHHGPAAGVDRFGLPLAPLGPWASKPGVMARRGHGPVLAPHGASSRVIRNFATQMQRLGRQLILSAGWDGFVSPRGFPIMQAHILGNRRLPMRDVAGVGPDGMRKVGELVDRLIGNIASGDV